jgi:hypothetical protein
MEGIQMKVYLVMGNYTPEGVFETPEKAADFISDRLAFTNLPANYYRILEFEVR